MTLNPVHDMLAARTGLEPFEGMGATFLFHSDREPGTVVEVQRFKTGARVGQVRRVGVQYDDWKVVSGSTQDGSAQYEYTRNTESPVVWFSQNKAGRWVSPRGARISLGNREQYIDPHF